MAETAWTTTAQLVAAVQRFTAELPEYACPVAFSIARRDGPRLVFGELNPIGNTRRLPAVILASVCGYRSRTGSYPLTTEQMAHAVHLLAPAEAATHMDHPNLWSWRALLDGAKTTSTFVAFYLARADDGAVDCLDAEFRRRLAEASDSSGTNKIMER